MKYFKFIKSHDAWEEDCTGWYDLYSVDGFQYYPLSDLWIHRIFQNPC